MTVPLLTVPTKANVDSTIRESLDRSRRVCEAYRRGFYIDADLPAIVQEMAELTREARVEPLTELFVAAERFSLSADWRVF